MTSWIYSEFIWTYLNKFCTCLDWSEVSSIIFLSGRHFINIEALLSLHFQILLNPQPNFNRPNCFQLWADCFCVFSVLLWFYLVINRKLSTFGLLFALFAGSTDTYVRKYHKKIYNIYRVNTYVVFIFSSSKELDWIYKTVKIESDW